MMKAKYKEIAQIGIYSLTGVYLEFKQGEEKEITNEIAAELKNDSRFEITGPETDGNKVPAGKGKNRKQKDGE